MRVILPSALSLLLVFLMPDVAMAEQAKMVEVEVEMGRPFDFKSLGGPDRMLTIHAETPSAIRYTIVDPRQMREVVRYDVNGRPYTELVAIATPQSASKSNGIRLNRTLSKLYPLYSDASLTVYFYDTLATRQNHRKLVVLFRGTGGQQ